MKKEFWYLKDFDFYEIICPYKLEDHVKKHPNNVYRKNDFLFMEDEVCKDIFLIDCGKVKVGQYDEKGNENIVAYLGKGEILGQMALMGQKSYRNFAQVMETGTQVCKMTVRKAKELTRDYVPFALEMNRRISGHIRKIERRIEILLCKNVKDRLIELLKDLAEEHGQPQEGGIWISHTLTQSDIASLIGTSRKSASLILNELADNELIEFDQKHIFVFDMDALKGACTISEDYFA